MCVEKFEIKQASYGKRTLVKRETQSSMDVDVRYELFKPTDTGVINDTSPCICETANIDDLFRMQHVIKRIARYLDYSSILSLSAASKAWWFELEEFVIERCCVRIPEDTGRIRIARNYSHVICMKHIEECQVPHSVTNLELHRQAVSFKYLSTNFENLEHLSMFTCTTAANKMYSWDDFTSEITHFVVDDAISEKLETLKSLTFVSSGGFTRQYTGSKYFPRRLTEILRESVFFLKLQNLEVCTFKFAPSVELDRMSLKMINTFVQAHPNLRKFGIHRYSDAASNLGAVDDILIDYDKDALKCKAAELGFARFLFEEKLDGIRVEVF